MSIRTFAARACARSSSWALKHIFRRPAANFPGKLALYLDPSILRLGEDRLRRGSFVIAGTNGKTTCSNLLADALIQSGMSVQCNRTGANLDSGIASSLLLQPKADWGVFECDELWLTRVVPKLKPTYVVLLNLFRDQLDRCGEIATIQNRIKEALDASPETTLLYNADDPFCAWIAHEIKNPRIPFGICDDLKLPQNSISDTQMCQFCSHMLEYHYHHYGQLGDFYCPQCGFSRENAQFLARDVRFEPQGISFNVCHDQLREGGVCFPVQTRYQGAYMIYNVLAAASAALLAHADTSAFQRALNSFNPQNGRLQTFCIGARKVLLNLAKNPTGFNQNIRLISQEPGEKLVALFLNDKEADGHDVSWIWDIDFEELADANISHIFVGGLRAGDLAVRLKYADLKTQFVDSVDELMEIVGNQPASSQLFVIANYTALPECRRVLNQLGQDASLKEGSCPA